jgi:hypothetical protein
LAWFTIIPKSPNARRGDVIGTLVAPLTILKTKQTCYEATIMTFLVRFTLEGEGRVPVDAENSAAAEQVFDTMSLEELVDHADFTGGVDVHEIVKADSQQGDHGASDAS